MYQQSLKYVKLHVRMGAYLRVLKKCIPGVDPELGIQGPSDSFHYLFQVGNIAIWGPWSPRSASNVVYLSTTVASKMKMKNNLIYSYGRTLKKRHH